MEPIKQESVIVIFLSGKRGPRKGDPSLQIGIEQKTIPTLFRNSVGIAQTMAPTGFILQPRVVSTKEVEAVA
jgi:hypothetical protein